MITCADVEKLLGIRAAEPSVLSLYLQVPVDPPEPADRRGPEPVP